MNYKLLIIGVLIAGLGIISASIYIGYSVRDVDVVDNAYEAGLKFDVSRHEKERLGWRVKVPVSLATDKHMLTIELTDNKGIGIPDAEVSLAMNRMGDRPVTTYQCRTEGNGRYRAPVVEAPGYYEVQVQARRGTDSVTFDESLDIVQTRDVQSAGLRRSVVP